MRSSIMFLTFVCLATAGALAATQQDNEILARAHQHQLEFRQGTLRNLEPTIKSLETAVARSPDNWHLWQSLGNAYMSHQGTLFETQAEPAVLIAVGERARDAFARALAKSPGNALLLASQGMAGMSMSLLKQDSSALMASVEEMNAAVRQAPKSTAVRLTRGFTTIHLPVGIRDSAAVIEDLKYVMETVPGGRPEDVLHVLLGDVYAEIGEVDAARREYVQVTGASRFAAEQSRLRLDDLKKGAVSPAAISLVRVGTGYRCAMCHAPGADSGP